MVLHNSFRIPLDCEVFYYPQFMSPTEATTLFSYLLSTLDLSDYTVPLATGREYRMNVAKSMFIDTTNDELRKLSEFHGRKMDWPKPLREVKETIQDLTGDIFDVCVCIYYKDGTRGVGFHSDLYAFGDISVIPSLSLGAEREFTLRKACNHNEQFTLKLASGSLIVMGEGCQEEYEHALLSDETVADPRINLTFRKFGYEW